jgi:hypothetical protein
MTPNYWLVLSSLSFLAPAIVSIQLQYYEIATLSFLISFVSSWYHITKNPLILYIDYPLNQLSHITILYKIIPGGMRSMPYYFIWLLYVITIYYYGYINKKLVWDPDVNAATPWHMSLHVMSALTTSYTLYRRANQASQHLRSVAAHTGSPPHP